VNGTIKKGDRVRVMNTRKDLVVDTVGVFCPEETPVVDGLHAGEVGFITANIRAVGDAPVGDTITHAGPAAALEPLAGYRRAKPVVFFGLFPANEEDEGGKKKKGVSGGSKFEKLRTALGKFQLEDASVVFEPISSPALGQGFRVGVLGMLHMDIVRERLERDYGLQLITSSPTVTYRVTNHHGEVSMVTNPSEVEERCSIEEPYVKLDIFCPMDYMGDLMDLTQARRGEMLNVEQIDATRVHLKYDFPLAELLTDFHDCVKSRSQGYASIDYVFDGFRKSDLVRLDICLAGEPVDALCTIAHKNSVQAFARALVAKLAEVTPRHLFVVLIQAKIGGKVIASEKLSAMRKDVTAKCYGGDISRKKKLLENQKESKKRMKSVGKVNLSQDVFTSILKVER